MLPNFKQRLAIAIVAVLGGTVLVWQSGWFEAGDGSGGLVLLDARLGAVVGPVGLALLVLPVVALGVVVSAMGNRLGGVFAVAAPLMMLGIAGGPADGWYWRAELPTGYWLLAVELVLLAGGWVGVLSAMEWLCPKLAPRLPKLLTSRAAAHETSFRWPTGQAWTGLALGAVIGAVISNVLLRSADVGQVTGALVLGFTVGGLIARASVPTASPGAIVLSPLAAGLVAYGYLAMHYITQDQVLAAKYAGDLLGLGLALPIHYAAAGVMGATIGVGLGQGLEHNYRETAQAEGETSA